MLTFAPALDMSAAATYVLTITVQDEAGNEWTSNLNIVVSSKLDLT